MEKQINNTGKRKTASAVVFLSDGSGDIKVNGQTIETYFPRPALRMIINQPFVITKTQKRFDIKAKVKGGGISAQAQALKHGISKALLEFDPTLRALLKKAGFLTRDARKKERKKYGLAGARKRFQYSKR